MQGFGVNTYKWVNAAGETQLVKYHWLPKQGVKSLTAADAAVIQAKDLGAHTKDLYDAIERGDYPQWDLYVQLMDDHDHPELDFDPLDDTKVWPENDFPLRKVGTMTLNRMPENFFTENEQIAFGTGVLVDGLDFSDDKMLVGRTFSYSDTQRYRVGPNYLQLPVNQAKNARVATNQRDGQMAYGVDLGAGQNPHVNYEPSITGGLREAELPHARRAGPGDHRPAHPQADPAHQRLHAGRSALPAVGAVGEGRPGGEPGRGALPVRPPDPGADGLALLHGRGRARPARRRGHRHQRGRRPWPGAAADPDAHRGRAAAAANLGKNGPRDVTGLTMTHCVPNERVAPPSEHRLQPAAGRDRAGRGPLWFRPWAPGEARPRYMSRAPCSSPRPTPHDHRGRRSLPASTASPPATAYRAAAGWVAPLCWIAVLLDGFDLVVVGTVVPTLQEPEEWALSGAGMTFVITIGLVGMMIGALTIGTLTDVIGRRKALIGSVTAFSFFTLLCAFAPNESVFGICVPRRGGARGPSADRDRHGQRVQPVGRSGRATTTMMTGYHVAR